MEKIYIKVFNDCDWDEMAIYYNLEVAIAASKRFHKSRIEIFKIKDNEFIPTYDYYQNGDLILNNPT